MQNTILLRSLWTVVACLALAAPSKAQELTKGEKDPVFIGRLIIKPGVQDLANKSGRELELKRIAESLDTQFISSLNATKVFKLVERKRAADLQEEQAFAAVNVDPNDKNMAQTLKMAGAKFAFLPQIDGFEDRSETQQYQQIGRSSMGRKLFLSVVVQVTDTTTGELLSDAPSVQLNKTEFVEMARTGAGAEGSDQILVELAKEMASRLCQELVCFVRPPKVIDVTGSTITLNRGTTAGLNIGDHVKISGVKEKKDPDSGKTITIKIPVGNAVISDSEPSQSTAEIEGENMGIAEGCVAKKVQPANVKPSQPAPPASAPGASFRQPPSRPSDATTPGSSDKPLKFE